jgi:hypothetical protein
MSSYSLIYCLEKFKNDFLDVDFDNLLQEQNNTLVNSNTHYLNLKNSYLEETAKSYKILQDLSMKFNLLINNYTKTETIDSNVIRHKYTLIDSLEQDTLNEEMKTIFEKQKKFFATFISYINFLNQIQTKKKNLT